MRAMQTFSNKQWNASVFFEIWYAIATATKKNIKKTGQIIINCLMAVLQWINDITINFIAFESVRANHIFNRRSITHSNLFWNSLKRTVTQSQQHLHLTLMEFSLWFGCHFINVLRNMSISHSPVDLPIQWNYCELINSIRRRECMLRITWYD